MAMWVLVSVLIVVGMGLYAHYATRQRLFVAFSPKALEMGIQAPKQAHDGDMGYDLFAVEIRRIDGSEAWFIDTGVMFQAPHGWGGLLLSRSSGNMRVRLQPTGVIDNQYRGTVKVVIHPLDGMPLDVKVGDKIAQIVFVPFLTAVVCVIDESELTTTIRGKDGWGSTDREQ